MAVLRKIIISLIILFCLSLTLIKLYHLSSYYFIYETKSETRYGHYYHEELPLITICGQKHHFINEEYYRKALEVADDGEVKRPIGAEDALKIEDKLKELSIGDQFKAMYSPEMLSKKIGCSDVRVRDRKGGFLDCQQMLQIKRTMNSRLFCFTLFTPITNQTTYLDYWRHESKGKPIVTLGLQLKVPELIVSIQSSYQSIHDILGNGYDVLDTEDTKTTNIYYKSTTSKLLSQPYDTDCMVSTNTTLNDCNSRCKLDDYIKGHNCLPIGTNYVYLDVDHADMKFCTDSTSGKVNDNSNCYRKCGFRQQCVQTYYTITHTKSMPTGALIADPSSTTGHTIHVFPSPDPFDSKVITVYPAMTFGEFLSCPLNMLALWLAFLAIYLLLTQRYISEINKIHANHA